MDNKVLGKIIVEVPEQGEYKVQFIGNLDSVNLPMLTTIIRGEFLGSYSLRRRAEELQNIDVRKREQEEAKALAIKLEEEKKERIKREAQEKAEALEKARKEKEELIRKENLKLEAERILKKEANRVAQQSGNKDEIEWAKNQLEADANKVEEKDNEFRI